MQRTLNNQTPKLIGQEVVLKGWINTRRDHGKIIFLDLRDRTGLVQVVCVGLEEATQLRNEWVVEITGLVKERPEKLINPKLETGKVEIEAKEIKVLAETEELPFDISTQDLKMELPTLLDYRPLTLRHLKVQAIFTLQEQIIKSFRDTLTNLGFTEFQAPYIVPVATEGGAQVFPIKYYDNQAYLCQSPQLYKQVMVGVFERVFSVARAYRAEPSITTRHLAEYISLDVELGFIDSFEDVMDVVETLIKGIFTGVQENCRKELEAYEATIPVLSSKIPRIKMREAQEIIFKRTGVDHRQEPDLAPEDEREICRWSYEEKGSDLIFITHYPMSKRPFYTYADPADTEYSMSFDLLGRGLEWVTGGRRINDYKKLVEEIIKKGNKPEDFELYLQAFKYGMPPEGGFALGAERITMQILGLENIREASLFPRDMERIDFRLSKLNKRSTLSGSLYDQVISLLDKNKIKYQNYEHSPVHTSEEAAKARGTDVGQGAKALVMYADNTPILVVISAATKLDIHRFKQDYQVKDLRMATPEEVKKVSGAEVGAVPPFGNLMDIKIYVDKKLSDNHEIAFNAGLHTKSLKLAYKDWEKLVSPTVGEFTE